jgi:hypothetical protein
MTPLLSPSPLPPGSPLLAPPDHGPSSERAHYQAAELPGKLPACRTASSCWERKPEPGKLTHRGRRHTKLPQALTGAPLPRGAHEAPTGTHRSPAAPRRGSEPLGRAAVESGELAAGECLLNFFQNFYLNLAPHFSLKLLFLFSLKTFLMIFTQVCFEFFVLFLKEIFASKTFCPDFCSNLCVYTFPENFF